MFMRKTSQLRVFFVRFLLLLKNLSSSVVFINADFRHFIRSALCFRVVFLSRFKKKLKKKKKTKKESLIIACCSSTAATALLVSHRFHRKKNSCESILSDKISSGKCIPRTKSQFCSHSYS